MRSKTRNAALKRYFERPQAVKSNMWYDGFAKLNVVICCVVVSQGCRRIIFLRRLAD